MTSGRATLLKGSAGKHLYVVAGLGSDMCDQHQLEGAFTPKSFLFIEILSSNEDQAQEFTCKYILYFIIREQGYWLCSHSSIHILFLQENNDHPSATTGDCWCSHSVR
jgi:hypothetical protein